MKDCPICGGTGKLSAVIAGIIEKQSTELTQKTDKTGDTKGKGSHAEG